LETVSENEKKRLAILIHIAKRREQLRHLGSIISNQIINEIYI